MNELIYESIPLNLFIRKYDPIQFTHGGYTYSDNYTPPKDKQKYGAYVLKISTGEITEQRQLNGISMKLRQHAEFVTMLFKYVTGASLFKEEDSIDLHRKRVIFAGECPDGWSSNYNELNKLLDRNPIQMGVRRMPSKPYAQISISPLYELQLILKQYNRVPDAIRYLMRLNYEADLASEMTRSLVYGKVLEIIDAIHPLPKGSKKDKRIEEYYPCMQELFNGITIKDLMNWANNRADTRHYAAQKKNVKAHPFLSYEELGIYEPLIDNLALNEVRKSFDLLPVVLQRGGQS